MSKNNKERHPRVFISYSHDSPEHADKILEFARQLREDGIDAILDQYEPWPEKGWAQWMLQQVSEADFVLMICTEMYYKGVMDKLAPGEKRGIKYEWNLINTYFSEDGAVNKRFLPVVFEGEFVEWIPDPFRSMPRFCVATGEGYEDLYRRMIGRPKTKKPKIGKLKSLDVLEAKTNFFVDGDGGMPKKQMPKRYLICGILGSVLLLWIISKTPKLNLQTIVDYQKWKAPCFVKKELITIDNERGALGKKDQQKLDFIIDTNSMYCILVRNEGPSDANHVVLTIPDANYVEVMREGKDPEEVPPSEMITLGNIQIEEEICVNAWANCQVSRHNATGVAIYNELGAAPLYVRTPVGTVARWINKYITRRVVLIFIGGVLICIYAHWSIRKLFRKSRQIFHRLKGA